MELKAKSERRSQQIDMIRSNTKHLLKEALRTEKEPPCALAYMIVRETSISQAPVRKKVCLDSQ